MRRTLQVLLVIAFLACPVLAEARPLPSPPRDLAESLLSRMTPEERIGQLFLVTFKGRPAEPDDAILDLIVNYHVSGVLLLGRNDNFVDAPDTVLAARALIAGLQTAEYEASLNPTLTDPNSGQAKKPTYIPLFVALGSDGEAASSFPTLLGMTPLPSQMALGATWDPSLAEEVGRVLGSELEAIGINFLIGPSLDVLGDPRLGGAGELGAKAFGGDPFWVSLLGKAFIRGIHDGAQGRMAVVAKHFPGLGSTDRPLEDEVATVRKSLAQLTQIELAPFLAVTGTPPGEDPGSTDGLLMSHIRYQGFQGNIRATTRPVSLDRPSFEQIMALEPLASWRAGNGFVVSDSLGSRAIRRFYDPLEQSFTGHLVAKDAFQAGNDLLLLSDFQATGDADQATTVRTTLEFFAKKFREDSVFAQRVDEAVLRILRAKLRLYGGRFSLEDVIPAEERLSVLGSRGESTFRVAQAAATLITPTAGEVQDRLGGPPELGERVLFFTDVRAISQCARCEVRFALERQGLEKAILLLYGPRAAGQVAGWNLTSYSLADLAAYLGEPRPPGESSPVASPEEIEEALRTADWLVFSVLDSRTGVYGSSALKILLDRRPDLSRDKRIVVFAHDVPFDLDATDVSKVDALYALYSSVPEFVDVAARLLFFELAAPGAAPVSVPGVGYDLISALSPDPAQKIPLVEASSQEMATPAGVEGYSVGDTVSLKAGPVLDTNGHSVPDGTPVDFVLTYQQEALGENIPRLVVTSTTRDGVAEVSFTVDQLGLLSIQAASGAAQRSDILQLDVREDVRAFVTVIAPTEMPTQTPQPTETASAVIPTPEGQTGGLIQPRPPIREAGFLDMLVALVSVIAVAAGVYMLAKRGTIPRGRAERHALVATVGGLAGYNYLALGFPGSQALLGDAGSWAALVVSTVAAILAWTIGYVWELRG